MFVFFGLTGPLPFVHVSSLHKNRIGDEGGKALGKALETNTALTTPV